MTLTQRLALALCWAFLSITHSSNAQTVTTDQLYNTGNIVIPTNQGGPSSWVNGVYQDNLTCWGWGMPGYCGPNAIVRPGNVINFSFGTTNLYQMQAISNILPDSGSGLRVNGYNFSFTAKNGNGWDDGRLDYLTAYTSFYDPKGSLVYNKNYDLNYRFNWTNFSFSETFNTPYASKDLGSVQYGFVGRDNNYWAGPYGPEVINVNFSLKYSVDPCSVNVLSSPSCPGYLDLINKNVPTTTTSTPTITTTTIAPVVATAPSTITTTLDVSQPLTNNSTSTSSPIVTTQSTASTSSTPTATNPQPKVGEVAVSGSPAKTTISTSQVLAIVKNEQSRISNLETSTAQQAVEQAQSASNKAQQESVTISAATVSQSQSSAQAVVSMVSGNSGSSQQINQTNSVSSFMNLQPGANRNQNMYSLVPQNISQNSVVVASVSPQTSYSFNRNDSLKIVNEEVVKSEGIKFNSMDPVFNVMNSVPQTQTNTQETQNTTTVNTKVKDNDAAGGVSLDMMAKQPKGFESYMGIVPDVAFYAPKDIYRGQVTVDNVRALRQLSSDRLHQQMVEQQYRK